MKDNNLELVYDNFASQLTSCEGVLGVYIDDNSFSTCFKKDIGMHLAFVSDEIIPIFTTQLLFYHAYIKPRFEYCCVV